MEAVATLHANGQLLERFYRAFAQLEPEAMAACYAPYACFEDEVFKLQGPEAIHAMWSVLCQSMRNSGREDWSLDFTDIVANSHAGAAHWQAKYRFSGSGRLVHNSIDAQFQFRDGLIVGHRDFFNFWAWSRQALGPVGWLLGWTPLLRAKVRTQAAARLATLRMPAS